MPMKATAAADRCMFEVVAKAPAFQQIFLNSLSSEGDHRDDQLVLFLFCSI
jgi:hypothetical protein